MPLLPKRYRIALDRLFALRAERGPYRFLVGQWGAVTDIDLAVRVLGTEFFRSNMQPLPLPVRELKSILVLAPHQDDEIIGAGGTLALATQAGVRVAVLYVTDGAQQGGYFPHTYAESAQIRAAEARDVCSRLGAEMHELGIYNPQPRPTLDDLRRLAALIQEKRPDVVLLPWLLDIPAKHRMPSHLLWLAHRQFGLPDFETWGYATHNTLYPNGYVDITEVADKKLELLQCFRSQQEHYQRYDHLAMGMAAWNSRFLPLKEPVARYVEVFFALPQRELLRLVERFYFRDLAATYQGNEVVLPGMAALHEEVTGRRKRGFAWSFLQTARRTPNVPGKEKAC